MFFNHLDYKNISLGAWRPEVQKVYKLKRTANPNFVTT